MRKPKDISRSFMDAAAAEASASLHLRLYVAGNTRHSIAALQSLKEICETYRRGAYRLEVVDVYQQPALTRDDQIIAVPTLLRTHPLPVRRLIGNLSDQARVLAGLEICRPTQGRPSVSDAPAAPGTTDKTAKTAKTGKTGKTRRKDR